MEAVGTPHAGKRWAVMEEKIFAVVALIGLALGHDAMADDRAKPTAAMGSTFARAGPQQMTTRPAAPHVARRSRPAGTAGDAERRGAHPGAGYCWYYIDRSNRTPGFWDLCRGR
jgi:hypothetical protein